MHLSTLWAEKFRRFTELRIEIEGTPRLVVLCGPNGSGKSSLLDAFRSWHARVVNGMLFPPDFAVKGPSGPQDFNTPVEISFHEEPNLLERSDSANKAVYSRTAYRNEPGFQTSQIAQAQPILSDYESLLRRSVDNDSRVSQNYQRLVATTMADIYAEQDGSRPVSEVRDRSVKIVGEALKRIFPDLTLIGPGNPLDGGTFVFSKGTVPEFPYLNLSAGEKATFDLILDLVIKTSVYDSTLIAIDEPDLHLNSALQGKVLRELYGLIGADSQLWVSTHSVGMLREARSLQQENPDEVAFLDFSGHDFDGPVTLKPVEVDRAFWQRTLQVALGDLADLIAPSRVVLCEGSPLPGGKRSEFDARCYRKVFGDAYPDTEFISVGNSSDVTGDRLNLGASIEVLVPGTQLIRLVDRDERNDDEIESLKKQGVHVLGLRNLESYLLDDSVLTAYCTIQGQPEKAEEVLAAKQAAVAQSADTQGKPRNDFKGARRAIHDAMKRILQLNGKGSTTDAFLIAELAPCLTPDLQLWHDLHSSVFGASWAGER